MWKALLVALVSVQQSATGLAPTTRALRRTPTALASSYLDQLSSGGDGQKAPAVVAAEAPPKKKKGWFGRAAEEAPYVAPKFDAVDPAPPKVKAVEAAPAAAIVDELAIVLLVVARVGLN